jgi:hypothetical protein
LRDEEGKYCKKYCDEILQKPPATWILTEEVSAGFAAVFGCSIFCGHLWSFCSQLREILREILHEKGQKTLEIMGLTVRYDRESR